MDEDLVDFLKRIRERFPQLLDYEPLEFKPCSFKETKEYSNPRKWLLPAGSRPDMLKWVVKNACIKDGHLYSRFPGKDEKGFYMEWIDQGPVKKNTVESWFGGLTGGYYSFIAERVDKLKQEADPLYREMRQGQRQAQMKKMTKLFADSFEIMGAGPQKMVFDVSRGEWHFKPAKGEPVRVGLDVGDRDLVKDWFESGMSITDILRSYAGEYRPFINTYIEELMKDSNLMKKRRENKGKT
jgi:hypothetical protein